MNTEDHDTNVLWIGDELIIYQERHGRSHLLNPPMARIYAEFRTKPIATIGAELYPELTRDEREAIVLQAVDELSTVDVISTPGPLSRRQFQRQLSSTLIFPMLISTILPAPAAALSSCSQNSFPVAVNAAPAAVGNSTVTFSVTICVKAGAQVQLVLAQPGVGTAGSTRVDDAFSVSVVGGGSLAFTGFSPTFDGRLCGGVAVSPGSVFVNPGPTSLNITSIVNLPAAGIATRVLNFTHCNFNAGQTFMPSTTVVVT